MNIDKFAMYLPARIRPNLRSLKFLLVGGVNTAFGFSVFVFSLWLGMHYAVVAAVATVLGVIFNVKSTGRLVFQNKGNHLLPRFISVYVIVYVGNVLGLAVLLHFGITEWLGGLILILPSAMVSHVLNSRYVFPS